MPIWRRIEDQRAGYLFSLSEAISLLEWRYPDLLNPVSDSPMVVASDYSGQHKGAPNEAYSFLVTSLSAVDEWKHLQEAFRGRWLPDGRHISFKQLREPLRWRALPAFLVLASRLRGNVFTFLIDRRIESFMEGGADAIVQAIPECFPAGTKQGTTEKMFRLSSLLSLLIAGLRREDQRSIWFSDSDETLETFTRREQFGRLASYLSYGLTRWRRPADHEFSTTGSPDAPAWAEDAVAIPDLVAGACCNLSFLLPTFGGTELWTRTIRAGDTKDRRARQIGNWMAMASGRLRLILSRLALDENGAIRSSAQFFAGTLRSPDPYGPARR